jgi:hypothetical protein
VNHLGQENVLWFKNWASIQSVRSVEHIHVLIRNYTEEFVKSVVDIDARDQVKKTVGESINEEEEEEEEWETEEWETEESWEVLEEWEALENRETDEKKEEETLN